MVYAQDQVAEQGLSLKSPSPIHQDDGAERSFADSPERPAKRQRTGSTDGEGKAKPIDPVAYWTQEGCWPPRNPEMEANLRLRFAKPKPLSGSSRTVSGSGPRSGSEYEYESSMVSEQMTREEQEAQYHDPRFLGVLASQGSFMKSCRLGIAEESKAMIRRLLETPHKPPQNTLFDDGVLDKTCDLLGDKSDIRIMRDINPLIMPSAEMLSLIDRAARFEHVIESNNEGWNNAAPFVGSRPQPDVAVGFRREAFSAAQTKKLVPFIGNVFGDYQSLFMATPSMLFPFLMCEVKSRNSSLEVANYQNGHSATIASRAIAELFLMVGRGREVNRQVAAFSISHNNCEVHLYGHYPVISDDDGSVKFYRHKITTFDITAFDGRERWTAYRFIRNVYDIWMPLQLDRIRSAVDLIPDEVGLVPATVDGEAS